MSEILNPLAEIDSIDSGKFLTPEEAKDTPRHKYFCPDSDCLDENRRLIFKTSKNGRPFFCHYPDFQHEISPETLLHKLTIKKFEGLSQFEVPAFKDDGGNYYPTQILNINPEKTILEFKELQDVRPDVTVTSLNGMRLAIEIFVTNKTKERKIARLNNHNLPTIEIDLNDFYRSNRIRCKTDIAFINENAEVLIQKLPLKKWLNTPTSESIIDLIKGEEPKVEPPKVLPNQPTGCLVLLILMPLIVVLYSLWVS